MKIASGCRTTVRRRGSSFAVSELLGVLRYFRRRGNHSRSGDVQHMQHENCPRTRLLCIQELCEICSSFVSADLVI